MTAWELAQGVAASSRDDARGPARVRWTSMAGVFVHPYRAYRRLHERHGDTLRVALPSGRRLWLTRDPALIRRALVEEHARLIRPRAVVEDIFAVTVGANIVASNGARWRRKRREGEDHLRATEAGPQLAALEGCARELIADARAQVERARGALDLLPVVERFAATVALRVVAGLPLARTDARFERLGEALALMMRETQRLADVRKRAFLFAAAPRLGARYEARRVRRLRRAVEVVAEVEPDPVRRELLLAAYDPPPKPGLAASPWQRAVSDFSGRRTGYLVV